MKKRRYNKRETTKVIRSPWDFSAEVGDLFYCFIRKKLYRLRPSTGRNKRDIGELTPREIKPPEGFTHAEMEDGEIYWIGD